VPFGIRRKWPGFVNNPDRAKPDLLVIHIEPKLKSSVFASVRES
jgi:hypothetical protein